MSENKTRLEKLANRSYATPSVAQLRASRAAQRSTQYGDEMVTKA